ncbi:uncharacterized protein LOC108428754 [Arapaima gigas]
MTTRDVFIRELCGEKKTKAEEAKMAAVEIVQDTLNKGMHGHPVSFFHSCSEPVDPHRFCCMPTEQLLKDLLQVFSKVKFKEDEDPETENDFAYVYPYDETYTVYLCKEFWEASDELCMDSKPGTLIHEASHFLEKEDVQYDYLVVELYEDFGTLMGRYVTITDEDPYKNLDAYAVKIDGEKYLLTNRSLRVANNANSLEYEFETVINHQSEYQDGRYHCCGETKKNSVCKERNTSHYRLHERFPKVPDNEEEHPANPAAQVYIKVKNRACLTSFASLR